MQNPMKLTNEGLQAKDTLPSNARPTNLLINYLPRDISNQELYDMFSTFGVIRRWKIVRNSEGCCVGYGFVEFVNARDAYLARILLNGREIRGKRLRVSFAKPPSQDLAKANLFVKYLPPDVDEAKLETLFESFGQIVSVRIVRYKPGPLNTAFVRFEEHINAQRAMNDLDGYTFSGTQQPISVETARRSRRPDSDWDAYHAIDDPLSYQETSEASSRFIFEDTDEEVDEGFILTDQK